MKLTPQTTEKIQRIVVGVDGSDGSKTALAWAMTQARLVGAQVEAVSAWQNPAVYGYGLGYMPAPYTGENLGTVAQKALDQTIDEVSAGLSQPVAVSTRVEEGYPAQVLPKAAVDALMLVVGSRGHGAFAGMVLGSVSQYCVQHMSGPVVVVPIADTAS